MTWLCWQLFGFYSYAIYSQYIKYLPKNRCIVNIFVQLYAYWPSWCSPILSYSPLLWLCALHVYRKYFICKTFSKQAHVYICTLYTCSHGHVSNNLCRTFCYDVLRYLRFPKLKKIQFILIFRFFKDIRFNIIPIISHIYIFFKKNIAFTHLQG